MSVMSHETYSAPATFWPDRRPIARKDYNDLSDKRRSFREATDLKSSGERWQLASFILTGVAVAGVGTGLVGFATRSPAGPSVSAMAAPLPGGGMLAISGGLP